MPKTAIEEITDIPVINIILDTIKKNKQALVFVNTKKSAEKLAEEISKKVKIKDNNELSERVLTALPNPTKQCERLAKVLRKGIAFHHAGLTHKQKEIIEDNFRNGVIRIICCTPSLAQGLDLPAFRAVIKDLKRYSQRGYDWIPVLEYHQQAGRAGRPKFDSYGEAICIAATKSEKKEIIKKFIKGKPEEIYSKLAVEPVLRTYLLSLIASDFADDKNSIMDFFSKTFYAHQFKDLKELENIIMKMLRLLEEWEFINFKSEDFVSADNLNDEKIKATILGKRVAELYIDPLTANFIINCLRKASNMKFIDFSFLQMISHTLEIRPLLRTRMKEYDFIQEKLIEYEEYLLDKEPGIYEQEYEDFTNSIKTALFFYDWVNEKDEEYLLENYNIRPGEIKVKLDIADWLFYCSEELARILHFQPLIKEILKLRARLKYGVKEELLILLKLKGIGRVRARMLHRNGIKDIGDARKIDINRLVQILGKENALKVKEQLGQDFSKIKVKEGKRKGQISLMDYNENNFQKTNKEIN